MRTNFGGRAAGFKKGPLVYEELVSVRRDSSLLARPGEETTTLTEMRKGGPPILRAFADDNDIQEITLCSSNLGMIRTYTKRFTASGKTVHEDKKNHRV